MRYGRLVGVLLLGMCGVTPAQYGGKLDVCGNGALDLKKKVGHILVSFHFDSPYDCFVKCRCWHFGLPQSDCPVKHNFLRWLEPATELQNNTVLNAVLAGAKAAQKAKIRETVHRQMHGATREEILIKKVFPPHNKQKRLEVDAHKAQQCVHKAQQCVHKLYNHQVDGRKNYARRGNSVQQPPRKGAKHSYCS